MAKQSGLGGNLYVGGYDLSGDTPSIETVSGPQGVIDFTAITNSAMVRGGGQRDGEIDFTAFFNPTGAHVALSPLPTADVVAMYCPGPGPALGQPAACMVAKQIGYDPTRDNAGNLTLKVQCEANGYGLEWGNLLTAGIRTDTAATNGTAIDTTASASFGWQAYLEVFSFVGTDVTVKLQDSADNSSFADLSGAAFAAISATTPQGQRIASASPTGTIRRYIRASTVTTGGVTSVAFAVTLVKNQLVGVTF